MMSITDRFLDGHGSPALLARYMDLLAGAKPVSASMVAAAKSMQPVKRTMADVTSDYWARQKRQQQAEAVSTAPARQRPASEPSERREAVTTIDADAVYAKWNSVARRGVLPEGA
jgi:hypothetical protein